MGKNQNLAVFIIFAMIAVISLLILFMAGGGITGEHRSGCHRWHTCPSDTGSYEVTYIPTSSNYPTYVPVSHLPQSTECQTLGCQELVNLPLPPGATKVLAQNTVGSLDLLVSRQNKPVSLSWVSPVFHWSHAANEKGIGSCGYGTSVPDSASLDWKIINSETKEVVLSKHLEGGDFKPDTGLYEPEVSPSIFIDDVKKGNYYWEINYVNVDFSWCGIWIFK